MLRTCVRLKCRRIFSFSTKKTQKSKEKSGKKKQKRRGPTVRIEAPQSEAEPAAKKRRTDSGVESGAEDEGGDEDGGEDGEVRVRRRRRGWRLVVRGSESAVRVARFRVERFAVGVRRLP